MAKITKKELREFITALKNDNNYRHYMSVTCGDSLDEEGYPQGLTLTLATNDTMTEWDWQSGDNGYSGGAYTLPHWAVVQVLLRSNVNDIVNEIFSQWNDLINS